jgi:prophage DNA circulation protein
MGILFSACTSKKACDKLDDLIDISVHGKVIVDETVIEAVVESVENVVEKVENVVEKVENVVEKVENVVEKVENVVENVDNIVNKV